MTVYAVTEKGQTVVHAAEKLDEVIDQVLAVAKDGYVSPDELVASGLSYDDAVKVLEVLEEQGYLRRLQ